MVGVYDEPTDALWCSSASHCCLVVSFVVCRRSAVKVRLMAMTIFFCVHMSFDRAEGVHIDEGRQD